MEFNLPRDINRLDEIVVTGVPARAKILSGRRPLTPQRRRRARRSSSTACSSTARYPDINRSDIERIEVVKGAAASSLYGAHASNGVIRITTR